MIQNCIYIYENRLLNSKCQKDFQKAIERNCQKLDVDRYRQSIKTYNDREKMPYMKQSLNLAQPEFKRIGITNDIHQINEQHNKMNYDYFQPLNYAG